MGMKSRNHEAPSAPPRYPGIPTALDGSAAVVEMETAASEAAGAYPSTPPPQIGGGWGAALGARRPRRLPRGGRRRLLPALRQERPGVGGPEPHRPPDRRAVAQPRHLRPGRLPHEPRDRVARA